ncbi:C4-dicarboxylate ABC transporter [Citrobacter amalonaticus]|uniref:C4-dicarboxylate ABC transporter n=1 Tax=Citrobacter amalonaticus TaxID=35703 RepID=A0A2S4RQX7_CITAM|nr:SLC13 family permease [Citrobacter amalonaticus]POT54621.1 C4-dicarboxylate ABC transporter [Citrobacter amalonaticus]POT69567.1 C4-dicarboxylate ABC transporter [Citrobacter amalonaticus]POU60378.1 C4-dicarboxylate ABC transporter [Citrobacter amalonaticus]POV02673.1 C4-dicarboxylate ABC transporter [Citrobacter amalonaticus]
MNISVIVILAIAIAITLGYKTKLNTGFFAIVFAYLIGCFLLDMKASEVVKSWPISIFFVIFAVSLFYNFALINGTLEKLAMYLLYACRHFPSMLPFIIYLAATFVASLGAGFFTVLAFFAPLTLLLCRKTGMSKLIGAVAVNYGALGGANFMTSASGIVFRSLIDDAGYHAQSFQYVATIFIVSFILPLLVIALLITLTGKGQRITSSTFQVEKPEPFERKQKINLALIFAMLMVVLIFPVLHLFNSDSVFITFINSRIDVGLVAIVFAVIALFLKLGDEKKAIALVPWNTLIMICGVGMLIQVAIKAGTIDMLAGWVGSSLPNAIVPYALALIGGMMSFFSSTLGVVCPALFPVIPSIAEASGVSAIILFTVTVIGAQATAISPFSSGGSLILGSCTSEEERNAMFPELLFKAVPLCVFFALLSVTVMTLIF